MVKEAYVSFEVAKLLKEKGFDDKCRYYYPDGHTQLISYVDCVQSQMFGNDACIAPTQQMAMKWLREKKIFINIWYDKTDFSAEYVNGYFNYIGNFDSYEEAVEQSIKYVLEHVI